MKVLLVALSTLLGERTVSQELVVDQKPSVAVELVKIDPVLPLTENPSENIHNEKYNIACSSYTTQFCEVVSTSNISYMLSAVL